MIRLGAWTSACFENRDLNTLMIERHIDALFGHTVTLVLVEPIGYTIQSCRL